MRRPSRPARKSDRAAECVVALLIVLSLIVSAVAEGFAYDLNGMGTDLGTTGYIDPATGEYVDSYVSGYIDPATGEYIETYAEQPAVDPAAGYDMANADVVIGYVAPEYTSFSPTLCTELSLINLGQLVYESVVDLDESLKPVPMLADSWDQDGKKWTFKLRNNVQFHNGAKLTAYDVVSSYQAIVTSYAQTPYYSRLSAIASMDVIDDLTLSVTATTTSYLTLYAMVFPVMQYNTVGDAVPRGTGPYWYIVRDNSDTIRLEANPLWWKKQPKVHSLLLKRYGNSGDALQAIRTREIDMLSTTSANAAFSRKLSDMTGMDYTTLTYEMLVPNLSSNSMLSEFKVRQAIMYAIDRSVIASSAYVDMAVQCEVPLPPTSWLYESRSAMYYYSPERALYLMNSLGWYDMTGNGKLNRMNGLMLQEPNITILTVNEPTNSIRENAANLIKGYLEDIGFNVTVTVVGVERLRERLKTRQFDLALIGVNLSEVPDLTALLGRKGDLNFNGFGNDDMESYLEAARTTGVEDELKHAYSEMQMFIVERLPIMGLLFRTGTVLSTRSLGGLTGIRYLDSFNGFEFLQQAN